jgi:hypothetical protein
VAGLGRAGGSLGCLLPAQGEPERPQPYSTPKTAAR